jgi:hypothetical protein
LCLIVDDRFLAPPKQVIQCGTVSYVVVKQTLVDKGISKVPSSIGLCLVSIRFISFLTNGLYDLVMVLKACIEKQSST